MFKDCSDLSGLLRKFYYFLFLTIKRDVIYFILREINLFLQDFRATKFFERLVKGRIFFNAIGTTL